MAKKQKDTGISFDSIYITLNKSLIERKEPIPDNYDKEIVIAAKDEILVENCDENGFILSFIRTAELDPKLLFFVQVEYSCRFDFDDYSKKYFNKNIERIKSFVEEKKAEAINITTVTNKASMVISFLTYQINSNPVITPPNVIEE